MNTLSDGGTERTVSNLSRRLSERYDVDIILNDDAHIDYPYGGRIVSLRMPRALERTGIVYQMLALLRRTHVLRRLKKTGSCAAVISFSELTNASNVLSGKGDTKTIVSVRNATGGGTGGGLKQRIILPYVCGRADLTVSCSREIADDLMRHYGLSERRSRVIRNGLDLPTVREMASRSGAEAEVLGSDGEKRIVSVGRMTYQKGQRHLLKAVKKLCDDGMPVRLILLGDGELRPGLEKLAEELGIADRVDMPGFVTNPYRYLARADVFVMPSLYEGFSNAILEALACGVPVISTDHETGAREILAPDTDYAVKVTDRIDPCAYGLLVPVCGGNDAGPADALSDEERLMAEAIERILADDALARHYREASLRRAEQLDLTEICRQWIDVIEKG